MDIIHSQAQWCQQFTDGHASGPQRLVVDETALFSFMHSRVDNHSDDDLVPSRSHHYRKGGCAVFDGEGVFAVGAPIELAQTVRTAANASRVTYDLLWPKSTSLTTGLELGSVVLRGNWKRFFQVKPDQLDEPKWQAMPAAGAAPISISPLPAAIVFENEKGQRLEFGLGDDLWRWNKGLNGPFLNGVGKLEISRTGNNFSLRRWVTQCDAAAEAQAAQQRDSQAAKDAPEGVTPPPSPVSQPEARPYRFNAYFAWSAPELEPEWDAAADAKVVAVSANGIQRADLERLGDSPKLALDVKELPLPANARRNGKADGAPCWCSRGAQGLFRRIIRQLANYSPCGVLVLQNFTPGWCETAAHANRSKAALHWDLSAMLDLAAWTRQCLGPEWVIIAPQDGIWQDMPSLTAIGAESGFRVDK